MARDHRLIEPDDTFSDKRQKFLRRLLEMSGGDATRPFGLMDIAGSIGLDPTTAENVVRYLLEKGLVRSSYGGGVAITGAGIDALEGHGPGGGSARIFENITGTGGSTVHLRRRVLCQHHHHHAR